MRFGSRAVEIHCEHRRHAHVKDILSRKSVQFMTQEQPNHQYSIGWNYTPKSNRPWIRTGSLAGTSALILKYPDGQCWILITNTSTWKVMASATTPWHSSRSCARNICRRCLSVISSCKKDRGMFYHNQYLKKRMDSLFLLQFACFIFMLVNAFFVALSHLHVRWENKRYERSRWMIVLP